MPHREHVSRLMHCDLKCSNEKKLSSSLLLAISFQSPQRPHTDPRIDTCLTKDVVPGVGGIKIVVRKTDQRRSIIGQKSRQHGVQEVGRSDLSIIGILNAK